MILRDAVAAQLGTDTGLTIAWNRGGCIQRLYPLTDGLGSIVAVADPSGTVQEALRLRLRRLSPGPSANWTNYNAGFFGNYAVQDASQLGWNWLYRGQQWVQTQPDTTGALSLGTQWRGLYVSTSGVWYDPEHARTLQPNLSSYGDPQSNPYQMTPFESFGATYAPMIIGIGVTIATGGLGVLAAGLGGAAMFGFSSYAAGGDAEQIAENAGIGFVAGAAGGATSELAGAGAGLLADSLGLTCANGLGMVGGFAVGAAQSAAFGATQGFVATGLITGNLADAVMAGWNGAKWGAMIGGPLGAIFHQVCFTAGTLVHKASGKEVIESLRVGQRDTYGRNQGFGRLAGRGCNGGRSSELAVRASADCQARR